MRGTGGFLDLVRGGIVGGGERKEKREVRQTSYNTRRGRRKSHGGTAWAEQKSQVGRAESDLPYGIVTPLSIIPGGPLLGRRYRRLC